MVGGAGVGPTDVPRVCRSRKRPHSVVRGRAHAVLAPSVPVMSGIAVDPSLAVDDALRALRGAEDVEWTSDLAAAFRARLAVAERHVAWLRWRVDNAEAAFTRAARVP